MCRGAGGCVAGDGECVAEDGGCVTRECVRARGSAKSGGERVQERGVRHCGRAAVSLRTGCHVLT